MTWLLLRTTGILALGLLGVAVALGIAGPGLRRPAVRLICVQVHRTAAVLGVVLFAAHVWAAIADTFVHVPLVAAVVPGASTWEPLGVALGTVAGDLLIVLAVSSALRRWGARAWWNVHVVSYVAFGTAWLHAMTVGTDASGPLMRWLAVGTAALVAAAVVVRLVGRGPVGVPDPVQPVPAAPPMPSAPLAAPPPAPVVHRTVPLLVPHPSAGPGVHDTIPLPLLVPPDRTHQESP